MQYQFFFLLSYKNLGIHLILLRLDGSLGLNGFSRPKMNADASLFITYKSQTHRWSFYIYGSYKYQTDRADHILYGFWRPDLSLSCALRWQT